MPKQDPVAHGVFGADPTPISMPSVVCVRGVPGVPQPAIALLMQAPVAVSQESVVQQLPSSQFFGVPATQTPPEHVSLTVQALPSSHAAVLLVNTQIPATQASSVQT